MERHLASPPAGTLPMLRRIGRWILRLAALFVAISIMMAAIYEYAPVPITWLMMLRVVQGDGLTKDWEPIEDISPELVRAVIAAEDTRFCEHRGFDWVELRKAIDEWRRGEGLRGASTISNQVARNVFLWPSRDLFRKGLEAYFTALIEFMWRKERIIEVYLNVAEWGPGIFGAEAAAQHYFGKPASELTRREASLMAAILPNPIEWSASAPGEYTANYAARIRTRMDQLALAEPLPCGGVR
jgi:monofunctional biosynthetic peptidoglycan transglycosylase